MAVRLDQVDGEVEVLVQRGAVAQLAPDILPCRRPDGHVRAVQEHLPAQPACQVASQEYVETTEERCERHIMISYWSGGGAEFGVSKELLNRRHPVTVEQRIRIDSANYFSAGRAEPGVPGVDDSLPLLP
jgi:hypothetical protein